METDKYYDILGVKRGASDAEIKRAFRIKAKLLHPDKSKEPNANANFALLNEAYEYLLNPVKETAYFNVKRPAKPFNKEPLTYEQKKKAEVEQRRAKARAFAKQKDEEYRNSKYYHLSERLNLIGEYADFFFTVAVVFVMPVIMTFAWSGIGLAFAFFVNFILLHKNVRSLRDVGSPKAVIFNEKARQSIRKQYLFWLIILAIVLILILIFKTPY